MALWRHELRLFLRQRVALPALLLTLLLAGASVWAGLSEVDRQHDVIERIQPQQAADLAAVAARVGEGGDAGNAAYYSFHATWDPPSPLAFAALGQRDVAPFVLRVRALALEGQIHEGENYNAELALPGRFDWAFVLIYIAPLILIVLLHDLVSGEREAGRLGLLRSMAGNEHGLWFRRVSIRLGLLLLAIVTPLLLGAVQSGAAFAGTSAMVLAAALYLLFWTVVALLVSRTGSSSIASAATLSSLWFAIVIILPALALLIVNAAIPVRQGVELTLAQRESVHAGWDRPKPETMDRFLKLYPEWSATAPVEGGFHWKWYYAFQHLGDVAAHDLARDYRQGLEARDAWTRRIGYLLPAVGAQAVLHRLAETDLQAQLAYQDRIRAFHSELRRFYYPYLFEETAFGPADFSRVPGWVPDDSR